MIRIEYYIINKDHVLYIEKHSFDFIIIHFKNGQNLEICICDENKRNRIFDRIADCDSLYME